MDATPTPSSEPGFSAHVEVFARATAALVVTIYGIGFVVLAVYEAHYGVFQFSPLRARIFLVGFALIVLVTLPVAAEHYKLAYYGPLEAVLQNTDPTLQYYRKVVLSCGFVYTAFLMASLFKLVLFPLPADLHSRWWHSAAFVTGWILLLGVYAIIGKRFGAHPKLSSAAAGFTASAFFACLYIMDEALYKLTFWFFLSGITAVNIRLSPNRLRSALHFVNWMYIIIAIWFYTSSIFGSLPPKFGGGAPVPVVLYLNKPVAWLDSPTASVSLLDETDQGFYVLAPGKSKALFIPRSDVGSLYFGPAEDVVKSK